MTGFVSGTCDVSGELSDHCVITRWYAGKQQDAERIGIPGNSVNYKMRVEWTEITSFDVCVSQEAIQKSLKQRMWGTRFLAAVVVFAIILFLLEAFAPNIGLWSTQNAMDMVACILGCVLIPVLFIVVSRVRGSQPRYMDIEGLEPLDNKDEKRVAFKLSRMVANKKAGKIGHDTVWSESRFKEMWESDSYQFKQDPSPDLQVEINDWE